MWISAAALLFLQAANPAAEGLKALDEGKYEAAAAAFTKAVAADPADYTAHFNLALAYSLLEEDDRGIAEYRKTLELQPGLYQAQLNLGILLIRQKKPAEAIPLLEDAAKQKPAEYRPRFYLAAAELGAGDAVQAAANYQTALEANAKSPEAQLGLARALAQQGKLADAAPHFRLAADLSPNYSDSLLELAALYEKAGQRDDAITIYRQFPDQPAAQARLGELLLENKQYADAIPRLEEAYAKSPTQANRIGLAEAYLFHKDLDKAVPLLDKAVSDEPANYDLRMMFARALRDHKRYPAAAQQFQAAAKLKPDSGKTWNELGSVLYLAEDYAASLAAFDHGRRLGEDTAGNAFLRAIIHDKRHELKPALEAYQQFLTMSEGKNPDQEWQARQRVRIIQRELDRR
jgi:tetratricopeptide (TPR) repeat protein